MRTQTLVALAVAAAIIAVICVVTPRLNVTLNEAGTDVIGLDFSAPAVDPARPTPEQLASH